MKKQILTACLYTVTTALLLGIAYPLAVTAIAQLLFHDNAEGQLVRRQGALVGSRLIGQPFTGPGYFHSRPSAAGAGYDAAASGGSNLAASSKTLVDRVDASVATEREQNAPVPVDLVTTSASGLDPDISPAAAIYQVPRIARERHLPEARVQSLVDSNTQPRQFGLLGEPRVNVLQLNLSLDQIR